MTRQLVGRMVSMGGVVSRVCGAEMEGGRLVMVRGWLLG